MVVVVLVVKTVALLVRIIMVVMRLVGRKEEKCGLLAVVVFVFG